MKIEFIHELHSKSIALHYLIGGFVGFFGLILGLITGPPKEFLNMIIGGSALAVLAVLSIGSIIWGIANLRALKTGKFPLSDYAVRKILKAMYTKRGLRDPVVMAPYIDNNGVKYLKFYFSVRFPVILFPVEVTIKYDNYVKLLNVLVETLEMQRRGEIIRVEYEKDENYFPKGIRFVMKDGTVREMKGELAGDLIFMMSLKRLNVKKLHKRMRAWGVPGVR